MALTRELRRAVCFHEAGHAVIHALGGAFVYRVAVAPIGSAEWSAVGRKGGIMSDVWGLCSTSDSPALGYIKFDPTTGDYGANRAGFRRFVDIIEQGMPGGRREAYRQVRSRVCGTLAGPAAEQIYLGQEPYLEDPDGDEWGQWGDAKDALTHAWLLPWRGELEHAHDVVVATLRRPDVWVWVCLLADKLEAAGDIEDGIEDLLPARAGRNWPPSPRMKAPPFPPALPAPTLSKRA